MKGRRRKITKTDVPERVNDTDSDGFKRGGRAKRASGGAVPALKTGGAVAGAGEGASLAKRARGGRLALHKGSGVGGRFARGGSPLSTAHHLTDDHSAKSGHEGSDRPRTVD